MCHGTGFLWLKTALALNMPGFSGLQADNFWLGYTFGHHRLTHPNRYDGRFDLYRLFVGLLHNAAHSVHHPQGGLATIA